ncbi:MAG: VanZ family protein [Actinomycetota bacterium]
MTEYFGPRSAFGRFAPPIVLMGLIYLASAQTDLNTGLGLADLIGRKVVHAAEYGLLFWLWLRAFGFKAPLVAAVIALIYAGTDEFHQTYVDGRVGTPIDVVIDAVGIAIVWLLHVWCRRRRARSQPRQSSAS